MAQRRLLPTTIIFILLFVVALFPNGTVHAGDYHRCGWMAYGDGSFSFNFDCDNVSLTVAGFGAESTLNLPRLKVDRATDIMPKRALSYTPIVISPKWDSSNVGHAIDQTGYYLDPNSVTNQGEYDEYRNVTLYIQASPAKLGMDLPGQPFIYNYLYFSTDAYDSSNIRSSPVVGHSIDLLDDPRFTASPAWNLSSNYGGLLDSSCIASWPSTAFATDSVDYTTLKTAIACSVHCTPARNDTYGQICEESPFTNPGKLFQDLPMFTEGPWTYSDPVTLNSPEFAYIYPGVSSIKGGVTDAASGQPAFTFKAQYGFYFRVYVIGDKWHKYHLTKTLCGWTDTYAPKGTPCVPSGRRKPGYYYSYTTDWYEWKEISPQTDLPGFNGGFQVDANSWLVDRIVFDGNLTDAVTIPVYQAVPILVP